jgi:hypothetical protein
VRLPTLGPPSHPSERQPELQHVALEGDDDIYPQILLQHRELRAIQQAGIFPPAVTRRQRDVRPRYQRAGEGQVPAPQPLKGDAHQQPPGIDEGGEQPQLVARLGRFPSSWITWLASSRSLHLHPFRTAAPVTRIFALPRHAAWQLWQRLCSR